MKKKKKIKSPVNLDDILHKEHATIVNAKATNELDWKNSKPNGMEKNVTAWTLLHSQNVISILDHHKLYIFRGLFLAADNVCWVIDKNTLQVQYSGSEILAHNYEM